MAIHNLEAHGLQVKESLYREAAAHVFQTDSDRVDLPILHNFKELAKCSDDGWVHEPLTETRRVPVQKSHNIVRLDSLGEQTLADIFCKLPGAQDE